MKADAESRQRLVAVTKLAGWSSAVLALTGVTLLCGVGGAVLVGRQGEAEAWARWSNVGQSFGALSSVISILGLAVLVFTARTQSRELREQRWELEQQRAELRRSAETDSRNVHMKLLEMAIGDPALAEVWPSAAPDVSAERNRQLMYANLIYQHQRIGSGAGHSADGQAELLAMMRLMFRSPIMREYWRVAESARAFLPAHSEERLTAQLVDEVYRECEMPVDVPAGEPLKLVAESLAATEEGQPSPQEESRG